MSAPHSIVCWKDLQGIYLGYYQFGQAEVPYSINSSKNIIGKTDYDLYSKEIADIYRQQDLTVLEQRQEMQYKLSAEQTSSSLDQIISKQPLYDAAGNIVGVIAKVLLEAPHEKEAMRMVVQESVGSPVPELSSGLDYIKYLKNYYEHVISLMPGHVYWLNTNNVYLGCNNNLAHYAGLSSFKDIVGKTNSELIWRGQAKELDQLNQSIMQSKQAHTLEEFADQPGKTDIFFTHKAPLFDPAGNVIGVMGVSFNITEIKRREEERLNLMLQASHMGTWTWNFDDDSFIYDHMSHEGPYRLANTFSEIIQHAHSSDREMLQKTLQHAKENKKIVDVEYRLTWIDNSQRYFAMRGKVVEDQQGQPYCMVGVCWDITERKQQEELRQKQQVTMAQVSRQNAMGELASTLAHELNQPLAAISNYIDGCVIRLQNGQYQPSELLKALQYASAQSARAGEIIHRIKNFMRRGELIFTAINVNDVIKDIIATMQFELTSNQVKLQLNLSNKLPNLRLDEIQIGQVILNLLRNAVEAMQGVQTEAPEVIIKTTLQKRQVQVDIIDNGPGCPEEIANQLFTAYFTTKKNGMGIGLAICRSIVEAHQGQLIILPSKTGAWFRFTLPVSDELIEPSAHGRLAYPKV